MRRLATLGVSWITSAISPTVHTSRPRELTAAASESVGISISPVPLLPPWISVVVVAVRLPESGLIPFRERQTPNPFRALPQIKVWDEQPGRTAMLRVKRLAVVLVSDPS